MAFIGRHFTADNDRFMSLICQFVGGRHHNRTICLPPAFTRHVPAQCQTTTPGRKHCSQTRAVAGLSEYLSFRWDNQRAGEGHRPGNYIQRGYSNNWNMACLLYTSDAADEEDSVDLGGR